jgi:hypothetical protein
LVTLNVDTDLDITNGTRATVEKIVLDEEEPAFDKDAREVKLKFPPKYILVRLERTRAERLPGLEENVIPLEISTVKHVVKIEKGKTTYAKTITQKQYPITLGYAFTDYRSQGQTIEKVIVDIATPPGGRTLQLFNVYVALSRSAGQETIRLLRDFDDKLFQQKLPEDLLREDERMEKMDRETEKWWAAVQRRSEI